MSTAVRLCDCGTQLARYQHRCDSCKASKVAYRPLSKSSEIATYLDRVRPCMEIPYGELTRIAIKFEVTRQLVRQVAKRSGYGRAAHSQAVRLCECGDPLPMRKLRCENCKMVPVECRECGEVTYKNRAAMVNNARHGFDAGRFCGRACTGKWLAREKGFTANPQNKAHSRERKTHCLRGHERIQENLSGSNCRTCNRDRYREKQALK